MNIDDYIFILLLYQCSPFLSNGIALEIDNRFRQSATEYLTSIRICTLHVIVILIKSLQISAFETFILSYESMFVSVVEKFFRDCLKLFSF